MRKLMLIVAALSFATTATAAPKAAPKAPAKPAATKPVQCREKGKFVKCPPKTVAAATGGVTKDKNGRCHVASGPKKGQFTKCP
jgi:hypothetical protein